MLGLLSVADGLREILQVDVLLMAVAYVVIAVHIDRDTSFWVRPRLTGAIGSR